MLTKAQNYILDSVGCTVVRNAISADLTQKANAAIVSRFGETLPHRFPILDLGAVFWDIMALPAIRDICRTLCGDRYRLDHAVGLSSNSSKPNLHGGPLSSQSTCFITGVGERVLYSQLTIGVTLRGQLKDDGGFCFIPGSHKSRYDADGHKLMAEVFDTMAEATYTPDLFEGDVVVFSESLVHGDRGLKIGASERRVLYYKFAPGFIAWRDPAQQLNRYGTYPRNDEERRLIAPPWSGRFDDYPGKPMPIGNQRRPPT